MKAHLYCAPVPTIALSLKINPLVKIKGQFLLFSYIRTSIKLHQTSTALTTLNSRGNGQLIRFCSHRGPTLFQVGDQRGPKERTFGYNHRGK